MCVCVCVCVTLRHCKLKYQWEVKWGGMYSRVTPTQEQHKSSSPTHEHHVCFGNECNAFLLHALLSVFIKMCCVCMFVDIHINPMTNIHCICMHICATCSLSLYFFHASILIDCYLQCILNASIIGKLIFFIFLKKYFLLIALPYHLASTSLLV